MIRVPFPKIDVGRNISCVRKIRGYTQNRLAVKMGVTQSAVSQFERNGDSLHERTLKKICDVLDVDENMLIYFVLYDESDPDYDLLIDVIRNHPKDEQWSWLLNNYFAEDDDHNLYPDEVDSQNTMAKTSKSLSKEEAEVIDLFGKLNTSGQREAVKRIEELTQLEQYRKVD